MQAVHYIESIAPHARVLYRVSCAPLTLQEKREKNIYGKTALYQILRIKNIEKLAKMELEVSKLTNTQSEYCNPRANVR